MGGVGTVLRSNIGEARCSRNILYWRVDATLRVIAIWGHSELEDSRFLIRCAKEEPTTPASLITLLDVSEARGFCPKGFAEWMQFVAARRADFERALIRSAIVTGGGALGAAAAGSMVMLDNPFEFAVFREREPAVEWLSYDGAPSSLLERFDELKTLALETTAVEERVKAVIDGDLASASLSSCAADLSMSQRALQRALRSAGTSFSELRNECRVEKAKHLLTTTDWKLLAVALEAGYKSASALAAAFRRATGVTPTAWRHRKAGG